MKFIILFFTIPFFLFSQEVELLGYNYYHELHPGGSFISNAWITPDEEYIMVEMGYKPSEFALYDFNTHEMINKFIVPGWTYKLYYDGNSFYTSNKIQLLSITARTHEINLETNQVSKVNNKRLKQCLFVDGKLRSDVQPIDLFKSGSSIGFYKDLAFLESRNVLTILRFEGSNRENENIIIKDDTLINEELEHNLQGDHYALIIGVSDYPSDDVISLDQPIKDAESLYKVLSNYTFEEQNITLLKNPSKKEILNQLDDLSNKVMETDNLLVFFAGHGLFDEKFDEGYWMPTDATKSRGTWIANSTIQTYLRGIGARNTLLIADACFGGSIFKTRNAFSNPSTQVTEELYYTPSCKAMTSGNLEAVPDKSVFIKYLVKRLIENKNKYLPSEQLFASFKIAVMNNSSKTQVPQFGVIQEAGDEGGDFIFIRK